MPEDAEDLLSFVHTQPGVVHVWLSGSVVHIEAEPGKIDRQALIEQLADQGFPVV